MTQLRFDETLLSKLRNLLQPAELIDETGRVIARVYPAFEPSEYEPCEPQISEEELQRRQKSDKWYTTAQVLAHLKSLEQK